MSRSRVLGASPAARVLLVATSGAGALALCWPFLVPSTGAGSGPMALLLLCPALLGLCAIELSRGEMDARGIAVLGILAACGAALRIPSPGVAGLEPVFFLLVLGGRAYGPTFGFALGGTTLLASALVTGGVGPWLPYQMLAAGWVGLGAGLLPPVKGRREVGLLVVYAVVACILYGTVMDLWFWPALGGGTSIGYVPGAPVVENLSRFLAFDLTTSLGFDLPRAVLNGLLVAVLARPVLVALRRAARRSRILQPAPTPEAADAA